MSVTTGIGPAKDASKHADELLQKMQKPNADAVVVPNTAQAMIQTAAQIGSEIDDSGVAETTLRQRLIPLRPHFKAMLPPGKQDDAWVERGMYLLTLAMLEDRRIAQCDSISLFVAASKAIAYGLDPGKELKECSIWVDDTPNPSGRLKVGFSILKKGFIKHLTQTGRVAKIEADVVRANDKAETLLDASGEPYIRYYKDLFDDTLQPIVGVWVTVTFADGTKQRYVEKRAVIDKEHRLYTRHPDYWENFESDAYISAALKEVWKLVPSSIVDPKLAAMATADDNAVVSEAPAHAPVGALAVNAESEAEADGASA